MACLSTTHPPCLGPALEQAKLILPLPEVWLLTWLALPGHTGLLGALSAAPA